MGGELEVNNKIANANITIAQSNCKHQVASLKTLIVFEFVSNMFRLLVCVGMILLINRSIPTGKTLT